MALFKLCRGAETNLPATKTNGYAYFCTDTQNFYIDWMDSSSNLIRSKLAVEYADKLRYTADGTTIEIDPTNILTKNNTAEYTPVDDYNPATKKYVDDNVPDVVTTSKAGLMSTADKSKLDGIEEGAQVNNTLRINILYDSATRTYSLDGYTNSQVIEFINVGMNVILYYTTSAGESRCYVLSRKTTSGTYWFSATSDYVIYMVSLTVDSTKLSMIQYSSKSSVDSKLPLSGGTMTGDLILNSDPTENLGAATKQYVDNNTTSVQIVRW